MSDVCGSRVANILGAAHSSGIMDDQTPEEWEYSRGFSSLYVTTRPGTYLSS